MTETTEGNEGNATEQPRRARSSTERSRGHRAKKKLEREAALQKADAEREAALKAEAERVATNATNPVHPLVSRYWRSWIHDRTTSVW
jgi:hypothetical protein